MRSPALRPLPCQLRTQFAKDPMSADDLRPAYPAPAHCQFVEDCLSECVMLSGSAGAAKPESCESAESSSLFAPASSAAECEGDLPQSVATPEEVSPGDAPSAEQDGDQSDLSGIFGGAQHW